MSTKSRIAVLSAALVLGALSAAPAHATVPAPHLEISEFYEVGGLYNDDAGVGSSYNEDYLELYNPSDDAVDPSGLYLYDRTGDGVAEFGAPLSLAGAPMVPAHSHYLIEMTPYGTPRTPTDGLPLPTPDFTITDPDSELITGLQVMLLNTGDRPDFESYCGKVDWYYDSDGTKLPTPSAYQCDWTNDPQVVDMVGTGDGGYETTPTAGASWAYTSTSRVDDTTDTDNNGNDFWVAGPNPQNSTSPARVASTATAADVTAQYGAKPHLSVTLAPADGGPMPTGHVDIFNTDGTWMGDTEVGATGVATYLAPAFTWTPGTYHLSYRYLGDARYTPAVGAFNLTVDRDVAQMSAQPATYSYGTPGEVDVTIAGKNGSIPTGTVTLTEGSTTVASGELQHGAAYIAVPGTALTIGDHTLTATYGGDHGVSGASTTVDVTVQKATTHLVLTPPSQQIKQGAATTLKITAQADGITPTGTVTISNGAAALGTATLDDSGQASFTLPKTVSVGAHTLNVSYAGDDFTDAATQHASLTVIRVKTAAHVTITASPKKIIVKRTHPTITVHVTGTGGVATGKVVITVAGKKHTLTLKSGRATLKLPPLAKSGKYTVTVSYGGSTLLLTATKTLHFSVVKR